MRGGSHILPVRAAHGEGGHPKGGGGVMAPNYPSTMLRMVPLPISCADREERV